jgi:hypothetical protein
VVLLTAAWVTPAAASPDRGAAHQVRHLAGHTWHYRAQIDGHGAGDRIVIVGGKDLTLGKFQPDEGLGHFFVRVHVAGSTHTVSSRQSMSYVSVRKPWTPWLGATALDRRGGKEMLVGFSTGTEQLFTALSYQHGRLAVLPSPFGSSWSAGEVSYNDFGGWLCTGTGVEQRAVSPTNGSNKHYRIVHARYAYRSGAWVRTHRDVRTVAANPQGLPPKYTDKFAGFDCPGLPKAIR